MPKVFDLSKIPRLVESQHPARILVVDTNILMNDTDTTNWGVTAERQNLFVLSDTLIQELEFIKQKEGSKEKAESRNKAEIAIKGMASLLKQGTITDGIPVKAGWFPPKWWPIYSEKRSR
jgi:predicted ribonuclease YlaK